MRRILLISSTPPGPPDIPKGVLHAHRALIGRTPSNTHWFDFREGDRILHSGRFNWTYVLGTGLMDPFYNGRTVVVHEEKRCRTLAAPYKNIAAPYFVGVPTTIFARSFKTDAKAGDLPSLRHCMCAGESLSDEMLHAWRIGLVWIFNEPWVCPSAPTTSL